MVTLVWVLIDSILISSLQKGIQSRRDWIYPWLLFPEAGGRGIIQQQRFACTFWTFQNWTNNIRIILAQLRASYGSVEIWESSFVWHFFLPKTIEIYKSTDISRRFLYTFAWVFGTSAFVGLMCLPPWPMWNRQRWVCFKGLSKRGGTHDVHFFGRLIPLEV